MSPAIIALACVTPPHSATQDQAARFAIDAAGLTGEEARFAETIYRRSGVGHRASCLLDGSSDANDDLLQRFHSGGHEGRGPTTGERMTRYAADAAALAHRAAAAALAESTASGVTAADITHIVTVSCTGFATPGIDHALIDRLGLSRTVRRLHIGYMGCHGAINALAAARAIVLSEPRSRPARVLVACVELCSLHFQPTGRPDQVVANALFADGAAALVVTGRVDGLSPRPSITATGGCVLPDSADAMGWRIGDHGFEMTLGESVPSLIHTNLRPWLTSWLDSQAGGVSLATLVAQGLWAVHPGGPRVLSAAADALGLSAEAVRPSRDVLAAHGNMSSPTVLFILDRLRKQPRPRPQPALLLAFGPGLSVEAALLSNA